MTTIDDVLRELARPRVDVRTVDTLVRVLAAREGVRPVETARELLAGLAEWFGIDFAAEAQRAAGEDEP